MKLRKGFTLVELLIVIVIIGILAGAMLLSSASATDSAEAARIISNLRSMKSATQMLYADFLEEVNANNYNNVNLANLAQYMDNPAAITAANSGYTLTTNVDANPGLTVNTAAIRWWVGFAPANIPDGVQQKLADRAANVGLFTENNSASPYVVGGNEVVMLGR